MLMNFFRKVFICILCLPLTVFSLGIAHATDHIDGAFSVANPKVDLTDLYAFTSEVDPSKLIVILNVITAAQPWERPDENVAFEILISPAAFEGKSQSITANVDEAYRLSCYWSKTKVDCASSSDTKLSTAVNQENSEDGLRVFAGKRSDPFVLNGAWAAELAVKNEIPESFNDNIIQNFNVFSIVVEFTLSQEIPWYKKRILAIGGQARNLETNLILDRIGRPEIANIVLQSNSGEDLREALNTVPALSVHSGLYGPMLNRIRENLDRYDRMSPTEFETNKDELAVILAHDFLTIDPNLPCGTAQYFDLEYALLLGRSALACGGRPIDQDVIDSVYGLMVSGNPYNHISDGVNEPTKPNTAEFPYLSEPNEGPKAFIYAAVGRILSDLSVAGSKRIAVSVVALAIILVVLALIALGLRKLFRRLQS